MNRDCINEIFKEAQLTEPVSITDSKIGFSNTIQFIDDKYVLKSSQKASNKLAKESDLLSYFAKTLPVPQIIHSDFTRSIVPYDYILMNLIEGESVYQIWSQINEQVRKEIIKKMTTFLIEINNSDLAKLEKHFTYPKSWKLYINKRFSKVILEHKKLQILDQRILVELQEYFNNNINFFDEEIIKPTYWDVHFDNFITKDFNVIGIIDLESVEYLSIDYSLLAIRRMSEIPKEYASEDFEDKVIEQDYLEIYKYFKQYYPTAYNFKYLDQRIDIYSIMYDLEILLRFPKAQDRIQRGQNDINKLLNL